MKMTARRVLATLLLLILLAVGGVAYYAATPFPLPNTPYEFTIKQGGSLRSIARKFQEEGLLKEALGFVLLARLLGREGDIQAGDYLLDQKITPYQLLRKITAGDVSQREIVFIEGWNFRQVRKALNEHPDIRHDSAGLSESELLRQIGVSQKSAEGLFFPNTYYFGRGMSDLAILRRAHRIMEQKLAESWAQRNPGLPYSTPYEALVMASIIEKETGRPFERPMIAAVFVNRLVIGMRLQTDPTVIYGLGEAFDGNLRKRDLITDTAYNTYTRAGLPPGPIAMPGEASIRAALHPDGAQALYFVSRGDGTHHFSRNLAEHNQAVTRYQKSPGKPR